MASLPYMQLYVAEYLADTIHLTTEEHGAYILMLMNYWTTEKPLKSERIPSVVRMDKERFANIEETLSEFFEIEDGLWYHRRVQNDLEAVRVKSEKASESAKKRWENKKRNANALQTECHKDKKREDNNMLPETESQFESIWKWYYQKVMKPQGRKGGKKSNAKEKFKKLISSFDISMIKKLVENEAKLKIGQKDLERVFNIDYMKQFIEDGEVDQSDGYTTFPDGTKRRGNFR